MTKITRCEDEPEVLIGWLEEEIDAMDTEGENYHSLVLNCLQYIISKLAALK